MVIVTRSDWDEMWLKQHLPEGYWAYRHFGRWDLFKNAKFETEKKQTSEAIYLGVRTRWEVLKLAQLDHQGRRLPYRYSREYWQDIEQGRSKRWARVLYFLWRLRWLV